MTPLLVMVALLVIVIIVGYAADHTGSDEDIYGCKQCDRISGHPMRAAR